MIILNAEHCPADNCQECCAYGRLPGCPREAFHAQRERVLRASISPAYDAEVADRQEVENDD